MVKEIPQASSELWIDKDPLLGVVSAASRALHVLMDLIIPILRVSSLWPSDFFLLLIAQVPYTE